MSSLFSLLMIAISLILLLNPIQSVEVNCQFSASCTCLRTTTNDTRKFDSVTCQPVDISSFLFFNATQRKTYTVLGKMTVYTKVDKIPKDAFAIFDSINTLSLEQKGTVTEDVDWHSEAFNEVRIKSLEVNGICIFPLPEATQKLNPWLTDLSMTKCSKETVLNQTTLAYLPNLRSLSIDQSSVADINDHDLDVLQNLEKLVLTDVGLSKIPDKWACKVKTLDVSSNNISIIGRDDFNYTNNYREIDLRNNPISLIERDAFRRLNNVKILNLQNINITSVDLALFGQLEALTSLIFDNSQFIDTVSASQVDLIKFPDDPILISLNNMGNLTIDSNVDKLMQKYPLLTISIADTNIFRCSPSLVWMAKRALCMQTIKIDNAYCTGEGRADLLSDYLNKLAPDICAKSTTSQPTTTATANQSLELNSTSSSPIEATPTTKGALKSAFGYTTLITSFAFTFIASRW